ncbi:MAG: hypothetical protein WC273_11700, partial [Dehalococcoidia bacterium]
FQPGPVHALRRGDGRPDWCSAGLPQFAAFAAAKAVNWAERYQGPVILLTEASIAERAQDIRTPDTSKVVEERRSVSTGAVGNLRYSGDGVTPFPVPGGPGAYVANGSEHDEQGDTTHLPEVHVAMTDRRFAKLKVLNDGTFEAENTGADVVLLPWGGSKGAARAAWNDLRAEGVNIAWYYTMFINPLPDELLATLKQKRLVLVPELNYLGQFSAILRSLGVNAHSITQYTGLPFKVSDLKSEIRHRLDSK